jgi:hypothetical protein
MQQKSDATPSCQDSHQHREYFSCSVSCDFIPIFPALTLIADVVWEIGFFPTYLRGLSAVWDCGVRNLLSGIVLLFYRLPAGPMLLWFRPA